MSFDVDIVLIYETRDGLTYRIGTSRGTLEYKGLGLIDQKQSIWNVAFAKQDQNV